MNDLVFTYATSIANYRAAVYFASITRHRVGFRIFVVSAIVAAICMAGTYIGLMPVFMLPAYIFLGYLVWAIILCAQIEYGILKYSKHKESMLHKEMTLTFARGSLKIDTPHNGKSSTIKLLDLFLGFELSNMFLLYLDGAQSIMLPHRAMTPQQRAEVREILQDNLHDRFTTRFGYGATAAKLKPLAGKKRGLF
ncbi:MAG TPA: YcxB family protein [Clostridia bacterium]|nr:YcxB family protein [Clostridia bacterium]